MGFLKTKKFGKGALKDYEDIRDLGYDEIALGAPPIDWNKGYDIEQELNLTIPFKNQDGSSSCVGQGWAYYIGILNAVETGYYDETSAKAIYSQIWEPEGGAYIRNGGKLVVNWGALPENRVTSYMDSRPPNEEFMRQVTWKSPEMNELAKVLQAKEYRTVTNISIDIIAAAIRDNRGCVGGVMGSDKAWKSLSVNKPDSKDWGHCIFFGKYGIDELGKYIATPNSWGDRFSGQWQKVREDYFQEGFMFNPWTLVDKPNPVDGPTQDLIQKYQKKFIVEGEGHGRVGIVIDGQLREIRENRRASSAIYVLTNNGDGITVSTEQFNKFPKGKEF